MQKKKEFCFNIDFNCILYQYIPRIFNNIILENDVPQPIDDSVLDLAEFILESDAIEGYRDDIDVLLRQIKAKKKTGHVGAMLLLDDLVDAQITQYLDQELICRVQGLIVAEQDSTGTGRGFKLDNQFIGQYRNINVMVGKARCPAWQEVPTLMRDLLARVIWLKQNGRFQDVRRRAELVADFHFDFLTIHPFADDNGRSGRAAARFLLKNIGIKPFIFTSEDKHETYYKCFDKHESMREYFFDKLKITTQ